MSGPIRMSWPPLIEHLETCITCKNVGTMHCADVKTLIQEIKTAISATLDGSIHLDVAEDDCAKSCPEDSIKRRWAVRGGPGVSQILMDRYSDEDGKDVKGHEVAWRDVATINSYNDSEWILIALRSI